MSIHYDGSQPLFTVDPSYGTTLYIGTTAFIDKNGLGVFDRDQSGQFVATHNATSFSAWGIAKPYKIYQPSFDVRSSGTYNYTEWAPGSAGQTNNPDNYYAVSYTPLNLARQDGFSIAATGAGTVLGELTFQGVRAYDSTTSQCASPDFYAGDVNDPASQRPFMWNGNNPAQYSDPSGYLILSVPKLDFGATYRRIGQGIWNFVAGDDIATLRDSRATGLAKAFAVGDLALNFIPDAKGAEALGKLAKAGIELVARGGHAEIAIVSQVAAGRVTVENVINTCRNGREFFDTEIQALHQVRLEDWNYRRS